MNHLAVAHVDAHMADTAAIAVEQQISCLNGSQIYRCTAVILLRCGSGKADAVVGEYGLGKSGAVRAVCQAGTAVYIGITHKLYRIIYKEPVDVSAEVSS